ncbi:MAG TPA: hypothetical protein VFS51_04830, partial [Gemmatimonadales bacterium]|nr:hypothetical protein [Gemmatimonadales bacterium]
MGQIDADAAQVVLAGVDDTDEGLGHCLKIAERAERGFRLFSLFRYSSDSMPRLLTPKLLLRGFEISVLASLVGFGVTLLYGNDL